MMAWLFFSTPTFGAEYRWMIMVDGHTRYGIFLLSEPVVGMLSGLYLSTGVQFSITVRRGQHRLYHEFLHSRRALFSEESVAKELFFDLDGGALPPISEDLFQVISLKVGSQYQVKWFLSHPESLAAKI